jgi:Anti-sigma-K factor rskA
MLSDRDIEAAHPDAFDFVFGDLPSAKRADFNRHLIGCRYCLAVVNEYSEIGAIIKQLPPHVDPPAELEDRIVGAMVATLADAKDRERLVGAEDQGSTRVYPVPEVHHAAEAETKLQPRPQFQPPPEAGPHARPLVTRLPVWRRTKARLAAVAAAAAAIIAAALVVIPSLGGVTVAVSLTATATAKQMGDGAATGQAIAHPSGPSWTFTMTVHGLKVLPGPNDVYECWWIGPKSTPTHPQFISGGTFVVDKSGSTTVTMTTGVDPRDFRTMEVTAESPGTGALSVGAVILSSRAL